MRSRNKGRRWREEKETWRIAFWNVAGLGDKDKDFWRKLGE